MAGRSRRKRDWESPVGDPDQLDIIAKRRDGGVDLFIVVARPLDLSKETRDVFAQKFRGYCQYVASQDFEDEFGAPSEDRVCIVVRSDWEVPEELMQLMLQIGGEEDVQAELAVKYE
jgi:hypothetical protein